MSSDGCGAPLLAMRHCVTRAIGRRRQNTQNNMNGIAP
jgi:hypothetical protein